MVFNAIFTLPLHPPPGGGSIYAKEVRGEAKMWLSLANKPFDTFLILYLGVQRGVILFL